MKKVLFTAVLVLATVTLVAAEAPKKVLSTADVDAFIANYDALEEDLNSLEGDYEYLFASLNEDMNDESVTAGDMFTNLRMVKIPEEVQAVFKKHGLGSNGFEKMAVITAAYQSVEMEQQMNLYREQFKDSPEMQPYLEMALEQMDSLKASLHESDMAVVQSRLDSLRTLFAAE